MSNVHNLKPYQFPKGVSGNPNGRPRKIPGIDEIMSKVLSEETDGITAAEQVFRAVLKQAIAGNLHAAEMLWNRAYGKPKEAIQQDNELQITIVREPDDLTTDELRAELDRARDIIQQGKAGNAEVQQSMIFGGKKIYF